MDRKTFTVRLPLEEAEAFDSYAEKVDRNKSDIVREYIRTLSQTPEIPVSLQVSFAADIIYELVNQGLIDATTDIEETAAWAVKSRASSEHLGYARASKTMA